MKRSLLLVGFGIVLAVCGMTSAAQAQATRTWVSGVGDDANPCSRTAPCKTWAGAISKTADCGEIDALDPGGFGTVTITKGVTLDGGGGEGGQVASILAVGVPAITINDSSPTCQKVVIRNMDLEGIFPSGSGSGTFGINIASAGAVSVENVSIRDFSQVGINDAPSTHANLTVRNSVIENMGGGGIFVASGSGTSRVAIINSTIQRSGAAGGNAGLTVGAGGDVEVLDSSFVQNSGGGVLANNATAKVTLTNSMISDNQVFGVHSTGSAVVQMAGCSVTYNAGTGLLADGGGQILTWTNNYVGGNTTDGARTGTVLPM
jgi:hypothetical protein